VSIRAYTGEYLTNPAAVHLGLNWCTHNCWYCFANLNQPDRRADYDEVNRTLKNVLARNDSIKHLPTRLILSGHPILTANDSDPFAKSNDAQFATIFDAFTDAEVRFVFQTRGGDRAVRTLQRSKPTTVYISFTSDRPEVIAKGEPGAPSFEHRKELAIAAKAEGHHVIVGMNPFYPPWWSDADGFAQWMADNGIRHVWFGELHLVYQQVANIRGRAALEHATAIEYASKRKRSDPAVEAMRGILDEAEINVFSGSTSKHGGFWDAHFDLGFPFFPTLEWFFGKLREHGEIVAFDFDLFDQAMNAHPELRSASFKEYLSGVGRSLRNAGFDQKAQSYRDVHETLWKIDQFPTKLRHDDIFLATDGDGLAVDDEGRPIVVCAPGRTDPVEGRIDLSMCSEFLTAEQ